ncbi:TonB-dependent receptor plug domain-containing protein [bacterium]|nr:TonB-dependent receptor plug domain-containing protein [bacterium]
MKVANVAARIGRRYQPLLVISTLLALGAGQAAAQQAPQGESAGSDVIVITAERRESAILDTPVAVTALTSEIRDRLAIQNQQDLALFTPGLSFSDSPNRLAIRGFGRLNNTPGNDPGVATYEDGFYTSETASLASSILSTDRIEVLRGPQGTLYGRNSIGGAANVISKRPGDIWEGEVRLGTNDYGLAQIDAAYGGPLNDDVGVRFDYTYRDQADGFIRNLAGPDERDVGDWSFKAQLDWAISDRMNFWIRYSRTERDFSPGGQAGGTSILADEFRFEPFTLREPFRMTNGQTLPAGTLITPRVGGLAANSEFRFGPNPSVRDPFLISKDFQSRQSLDNNNQFIAHFTWDFLDTVAFNYIGGYSEYDFRQFGDVDQTSRSSFLDPATGVTVSTFAINDTVENKQWQSHEFQMLSTDEGRWDWIGGLYYYYENTFQYFTNLYPNEPALRTPQFSAAAAVPDAPANPRGISYYQDGDVKGTAYAAYFQTGFDISDAWRLTTGLRYSFDRKSGTEANRQISFNPYQDRVASQPGIQARAIDITADPFALANPALSQNALRGARRPLGASWDGVTARINLDWRPDASTLIYGNVNKGYKSGGFKTGQYDQVPYVGEESVISYEVGYKAQIGSTLQLSTAAFYNDYRDLQLPITITNANNIIQRVFINAPKSYSRGLEVETTWRPIDQLTVLGVYSYLDTEVKEGPLAQDVVRGGFQPTSGNDLARAPDHKFTLNGIYTFPFFEGELGLVGTYSYTGSQYYEIFSIPFYEQEGFSRVDARVFFDSPDRRWTINAGVRNATDEEIINGLVANAPLTIGFVAGQPNANNIAALPTGVTAIAGNLAGNPADQGGARRAVTYNEPRVFTLELQVRF